MDRLTKNRRSWNMSQIKGRNTSPEMRVRSVLHSLGLRYRLHKKGLPGRPDMVFQRDRIAVFVHGCFWHRHSHCKLTTTPSTNAEFWKAKFAENVLRDRRNLRALRRAGWEVRVVWECDTISRDDILCALDLKPNRSRTQLKRDFLRVRR
jgi:DNA mismatch endonuclease (patch repair protein)